MSAKAQLGTVLLVEISEASSLMVRFLSLVPHYHKHQLTMHPLSNRNQALHILLPRPLRNSPLQNPIIPVKLDFTNSPLCT